MVSHNRQGQITLGWKIPQNLQNSHLYYPESDILSDLFWLPREAWCDPPLHRVQCRSKEEDIITQEWHEQRRWEGLWLLWTLGNIPQRPTTRLFNAKNLLFGLLWGSGEEGGWLPKPQEAGGAMDGHPRQPGEPGPGGGYEQAGWRQGWGSQLGNLTGEWRTNIFTPGFFKKWNLNIPGPSKNSEAANVSEDPNFKTPKPKCRKFIFKPFIRTPNGLEHDESKEPVDVIIPEQLAASYGLYLWPSAPVLGEFM